MVEQLDGTAIAGIQVHCSSMVVTKLPWQAELRAEELIKVCRINEAGERRFHSCGHMLKRCSRRASGCFLSVMPGSVIRMALGGLASSLKMPAAGTFDAR